jgi:hypothetical protein
MKAAKQMVMVPEELFLRLQKERPNLRAIAEATPEATQIAYRAAERSRLKRLVDASNQPLLVDLAPSTRDELQNLLSAQTEEEEEEPKLEAETKVEDEEESVRPKTREVNEEGEFARLKALILTHKPPFLAANGIGIKKANSQQIYSGSSLDKSIRHIISPGKRAPAGTSVVKAFLDSIQTGGGIKKKKSPMKRQRFVPTLWDYSTKSIQRPDREEVLQEKEHYLRKHVKGSLELR